MMGITYMVKRERELTMNITLSINEKTVEVPRKSTVLDAINASGTYIPQLCKDPDMKPIGACRTCLIQVDGIKGFPTSCSLPAKEGMKISTDSDQVMRMRRGVIELTLAMSPGDHKTNTQSRLSPNSELTLAAKNHSIKYSRWDGRKREGTDTSNPVFNISMDSCILCGRCTQACQDGHQFIGAIDFLGEAKKSRIGTFMDKPLIDSICTTCGQCLSVCPTGAIEIKTPPKKSSKSITTTCPYCGVGCGLKAQTDDNGQITQMLDDPNNQSSLGMLCVKGRFGYTFINHKDRLTTPLIRRDGILTPSSWKETLEYTTKRLME